MFPPHILCSKTQHFQKKKIFALEIFQIFSLDFFKLIPLLLRLLDRNSRRSVMIQTAREAPSNSIQCNFREYPDLAFCLCSCSVYLWLFFNDLVCSH